jgi:four helix bundle protein
MATIKRFEDINAWQKARELANTIYKITIEGEFAKNFDLKNQINKSAGSIMDNIAEGFGRGGRKEFINFLGISKGSLDELKSQLYRAMDRNYITREVFDNLYNNTDEVGKMIAAFMVYLNKSDIDGEKFKNRTN